MQDPVRWTSVKDFSLSRPEDRHYVVDTLRGEVSFGPNLRLPDGRTRRYGQIPPKGHAVWMARYRYGGGSQGNVTENRVRTMRQSIPYISSVTNPRPAIGGSDLETVEHAKMRVRDLLHTRDRAVTAEDFESLALRATGAVGRARCFFPEREGIPAPPGTVRVLVIPRLGPEFRRPLPRDLQLPSRVRQEVAAYLDERRLLTTKLELAEPTYRYVSIELALVAFARSNVDEVRDRVIEVLENFIHPIWGGTSGKGWPYKRALKMADIYSQVLAVRGVAFPERSAMFVSSVLDAATNAIGAEERVDSPEGIILDEGELFCVRDLRVTVVPSSVIDREREGDE